MYETALEGGEGIASAADMARNDMQAAGFAR